MINDLHLYFIFNLCIFNDQNTAFYIYFSIFIYGVVIVDWFYKIMVYFYEKTISKILDISSFLERN
jgi:hypothetical protein